MSDISIPGVTASKYKTDELIQALMKVERLPRDRADAELEVYREQQSAWREINQHSASLRDTSKSLYSFNNPFNEKIASSTNERALTATVKREARDRSFKIAVDQVAEADSFLSAELPKDGKVPSGEYTFTIGEHSFSFNWRGGSWREFSDALNRRGEGFLRTSIIQTTSTTQAILFESQKTGSAQRLGFEKAALDLALSSGLIAKNDTSTIKPDKDSIVSTPLSNAVIPFSETVRAKAGLTLEYTVTVTPKTPEDSEDAQSGEPNLGSSGTLTYKGITIENAPPEIGPAVLPDAAPKEPVTDQSVASLRSTRGIAIPLPEAKDGTETVSVPLAEFGDVNALLIHNRNTDKTVRVSDIRIFDPKAAGEYIPLNPVSTAQDAILKYEGIKITRPTNEIEDLVPGVTINLFEQTDKAETLTVKPDTETVKEAVISLVARYNRAIAEINILTQNKPEIITEIQYFTPDEKKAAEERLGMMQGDTTLNGIKSNLQRIASGVYRPTDTTTLTMLSQIGIATKTTAGAGIDASRLRGYLEIDEKVLDSVLSTRMQEVKALFGFDTDSDLVIDNGVAYAIDTALTPYVQTGGIFATRISGLGTRITTGEKKIAQLDVQLADKEAELKRKYGQMEGTLNSLQNQSNAINNFSKQNNQ